MTFTNWSFPYATDAQYKPKVAYFCMEYAIDQALKIYAGGLGFLAGSHLRSAYELKQPLFGIGMLWKYGYYDQMRHRDQTLQAAFIEKDYSFLQDTGIKVQVRVDNNPEVFVKAYYLAPEVFKTAPLFLLSTEVPENDHLAHTICHWLYDNNVATRIAQSIVLGQGGAKVVEALGGADIYHLNEGHALPLVFQLSKKYPKIETLRSHVVFTTHTPEKAGNEEYEATFLNQMGFFGETLAEPAWKKITHQEPSLNYTLTALRYAKLANGVSQLHGEVSRQMWKDYSGICPIKAITNAQNALYWEDAPLYQALHDPAAMTQRKMKLKNLLFEEVANQTGKLFKENVLTIVWARRFAAYKRTDLLLQDLARFEKLVQQEKFPIQIIWAGKPFPLDDYAVGIFNHLVHFTRHRPNLAILTGYELKLSKLLKGGADVWLNTPRRPREASGTSGMTAAMNGAVNFSIFDGWICEFARHGHNAFIVPPVDENLPNEQQDALDRTHLFEVLEQEILPTYYLQSADWQKIVANAMQEVKPFFESARMAHQYYEEMYQG
ncbi:MAG: alpha-glucan family phosphorylase [Microscillaceae bacterium]|nr:alpha-glucan family phosphorylase [Microscillaceae bacterium]